VEDKEASGLDEFVDRVVLVVKNIVQCWKTQQIEHIEDLRRHIGQFDVSTHRPHILDVGHKYAQPGTGDVTQRAAVDNDFVTILGNQRLEGIFKMGCGMGIQLSIQMQNIDVFSGSGNNCKQTHGVGEGSLLRGEAQGNLVCTMMLEKVTKNKAPHRQTWRL
jgi:hypothetical protein